MIYRRLGDAVLIFHFCFILFTVFGGLLVLCWRWLWKIHVPTLVWGVLIEYFLWICPLTTLENYFRKLGGEASYDVGFIDYYLVSVMYPQISPNFHLLLGFLLLIFNLAIYSYLFRRDFAWRKM